MEKNNLRSDIFNEVTLQRQLSLFSIFNLLIIPIDKQQLIQTCTGKLIIGKLSELIGGCPINSDNFIGSDKIIGWLFSV